MSWEGAELRLGSLEGVLQGSILGLILLPIITCLSELVKQVKIPSLICKQHTKISGFLVVGPLREGGVKPPEPLIRRKKTFFHQRKNGQKNYEPLRFFTLVVGGREQKKLGKKVTYFFYKRNKY